MPDKDPDALQRRVFVVSAVVLAMAGAFFAGGYASFVNAPPFAQLKALFVDQGDLTQHPRHHHLQPARGTANGVTINKAPDQDALVAMAGFFDEENQIRLVGRNGSLAHKWSLDFNKHFPLETRICHMSSPLRTDTHGLHIAPSGDVIFNYEYCGTVKLDACGNVLWRISHPTHHSVVASERGGHWILGRDRWKAASAPERLPPFSTPATDELILEDTILNVAGDGSVKQKISIPQLLVKNDLGALLTADGLPYKREGVVRKEIVHSNKVAELPARIADAFPLFEAGDLAVSMRKLNLVLVLDPDTEVVKWHQTGPWLRQHDVEFRPDGRLSIFNNNSYRTAYPDQQIDLDAPLTSNIMVIDPVTRETEIVFGERAGQEMLTVIRGQHELLPGGGMIMAEFDGGRVIEVDASGAVVWEFVNKYDADYVGEITNAQVLPAGFFDGGLPDCGG